MSRPRIPDAVLSAAHERSAARAAGDWVEADRLRGVIEAAAWRVVDRGTDFSLTPAALPDVDLDGVVIYGSSASVPSRLDDPTSEPATLVVALDPEAQSDQVAPMLERLRSAGPQDCGLVIVTSDPATHADSSLSGAEVIRMRPDVGHAGRLNAGIRRAAGSIVILVGEAMQIDGDIVSPLVEALADPGFAASGGWGSRTTDLREFAPADGDADVLELACLAFRRDDAVRVGALDERLSTARAVAAWWSLALRFGSPEPDPSEEGPSRRVVVVPVPAARILGPVAETSAAAEDTTRRAERRDFYRLRDAFGQALAGTDPLR